MTQIRSGAVARDQELIARYIDPEWDRYPSGRADARLKDYGVPVWALIGQLRAIGDDLDELAQSYRLLREAVDAALAYYRQNKKYIDARILLNSA
jgi:uncharacterized protein (DUF433 family)